MILPVLVAYAKAVIAEKAARLHVHQTGRMFNSAERSADIFSPRPRAVEEPAARPEAAAQLPEAAGAVREEPPKASWLLRL